ncbi:MAG: tryptophanase [Clostridiales bacterium]|nr:tryptophanase [Clostridiales bacterium]
MANIKFFSGEKTPLEMHKVRIIQKLSLPPVEARAIAMEEAGFNTFLLRNRDVYLDMLTDSGVNAMSDQQQAAMMIADDSYAGSETFFKLAAKVEELFGFQHFLPCHQGRAAENMIASTFIQPGKVALMNFHFTTAKAHVTRLGGKVEELVTKEGTKTTSTHPFKGNIDLDALRESITRLGKQVAFLRIEVGTNLIGGQPVSLQNMREATAIAREHGIVTVMDASLLQDNLYFIKTREEAEKGKSIREITREISDLFDIIYFSARKLGFARGGGMMIRDEAMFDSMKVMLPLFEGFLTYGGMSVREMEAIVVGLDESMDEDIIAHGPMMTEYMCEELLKNGVPVVTPPGGLGCHINAREFLSHVPAEQYPAGALAAAVYIAGGVRGMERGTLSEEREPDGSEHVAEMELLRMALPRRVFTHSQVRYAIDRITWLHRNRHLIGGLEFIEEPPVLRFFLGRLRAKGDWQNQIVAQFRKDFGDSL